MSVRQLRSLRAFIFLLLTMFVTDTVYAGEMMVELFNTSNASVSEHCIEPTQIDEHADHHNDTQQKQSSNDHCSKCGHCMACFTVLPPSQLDYMQSEFHEVVISLFEPSYISHVSAQPHRPPIS